MKVRSDKLLLIACLVWAAAGFNVLRMGLRAYSQYLTALNIMCSLLVFTVFQFFVFGRLVRKHTARISSYGDRPQFFLKFFDLKSFVIMAFMMGGGIALRAWSAVPESFIAVFYSGLGASLLLAGILLEINYSRQHFCTRTD